MSIPELDLIQQVFITILFIQASFLAVVVMWKLIRSCNEDVKKVEKEYKEKLEALKKQLEVTEKLLESKEKEYKEQVKKYAKVNKMLQEIKKALDAGAVTLTCPKHGEPVTVLVDGTIICPKGHRVWPPEEIEEVEETVEAEA